MMKMSRQWIASSDVLPIFPTLVWKVQLTSGALEAVNGKILEALKILHPSGADFVSSEGWQSNKDLHKLDEFRELASYINDTARTVLQFLKIGYDAIEITGCWANINPAGASHRSHSHPNNFLSGVYYVQTHAGGDTINFHDPRVQTGVIRPPVTELTAENTDQAVITVSNGTLLIFPAYLQHSVDPNRSGEERISISFNMMFSSFTENLSKPLW
jgi:uncharacterized protein (TIGR02466 family)